MALLDYNYVTCCFLFSFFVICNEFFLNMLMDCSLLDVDPSTQTHNVPV